MAERSKKKAQDASQGKFPTLDQKLCFAIYASSLAMLQSYKPLLAELGITYPQYLVMLVLWEQDGVSIKRLSERLGLDSGSVTPLVKRLEEASFLTRRRDPQDERNLVVELTAAGRQLQEKAEQASSQFVNACSLSQSEGGDLRERLAVLTRTLRAEDSKR
ncbi:MarR family transcriptional regulator [Variovorax sp. LjRoot290]|uniref:MarR family winged helix-turn-helix transcriptional regulator n=1 Tax=unclassified Variovorax TaxID=663243 RepID=UPI003ECDC77C